MSDTTHTTTEGQQSPRRKLWPWVITSIVALLIALFLRIWVPQEYDTSLLAQIDTAGGTYSIDTTGRPEAGSILPEAGSMLDDMKYVELFDRVDDLKLPKVEPELFGDAVAAFKSLESLQFNLANSADFDRETAARMTELEYLVVVADEQPEKTNYEFLAGCRAVENLVLSGWFHDDGFWQFLPEMTALKTLELKAGENVRGEGIPDLSKSKITSLSIQGVSVMSIEGVRVTTEFHGFNTLLTASAMKDLTILDVSLVKSNPVKYAAPPALKRLYLANTAAPDATLTAVSEAKSLQDLTLLNCHLSGDSLGLLASLPLVKLTLDHNPLSADACRGLSEFKTLETLSMRNTGIKSEWIECWAGSPLSSSLEELNLSGSSLYRADAQWLSPIGNDLDDRTIDILLTFSKLKRLRIYQRSYSNEAILKLVGHPTLRRLDVDGKVSSVLLEEFRKKMQEEGEIYPEIR